MTGVALALLGIAGVGLALLGVEGRALRRRLRGTVPVPRGADGLSVLKPLRGVDDGGDARLGVAVRGAVDVVGVAGAVVVHEALRVS